MNIGKNQYILVPKSLGLREEIFCAQKISWGAYDLYLGEKTKYVDIKTDERRCLLIGYFVHSFSPDQTENECCSKLLKELAPSCENIGKCTKNWNGRWVFVVEITNNIYVINDACGLKQVFYPKENPLAIASQARYLASVFRLIEDEESMYYMEIAKVMNKEYSWPLDVTRFSNVKRLLPNHILSNTDGSVHRISFPSIPPKDMSVSNDATNILKGSMLGISKSNKCLVTLTAGWDSRVVMGASLHIKKLVDFVTLKYRHMNSDHIDIQIPISLAARHDLHHKIFECKVENSAFISLYMNHSENGHPYWVQMCQAIQDNGAEGYIWVKGSCNEILRNSSGILYNWQVTPRILCKMFQLPYTNFTKKIISKWLNEARPFCNTHKIKLLDLFYWEHRLGSWLAECLNEADVVGEMFSPFNDREYLMECYAVPYDNRISPDYNLSKCILDRCNVSPEIPINPNRYNSIKAKLKLLLKNRLHILYGIVLNM